ncbi:hypothetical protein Tco_1159144 [Tanacetum coccineum]
MKNWHSECMLKNKQSWKECKKERVAQEEASRAAIIEELDSIQAMIEADEQLAARLQAEEQEQFSIEEKLRMVSSFVPMDSEVVKSSVTRTEGSSKRAGDELVTPPFLQYSSGS